MLDETLDSFLDRLAAANRLDTGDLRIYLAGERRAGWASVDAAALSTLAGMPEASLRRAVLELSEPVQLAALGVIPGRPRPGFARQGPVCRICAAARGGGSRIIQWQTHENVVCRRHLLWTFVPCDGRYGQTDLREYPEIIAASRLHRRLIRRHGRTAVYAAFTQAHAICTEWHRDRGVHGAEAEALLAALRGEARTVLARDPAVEVATYRQKVALTRLLVSPEWSQLIPADYPRFEPVGIGHDDVKRIDANIERTRPGALAAASELDRDLLREAVLLRGKPNARRFVEELRRSVAADYVWLPYCSHRQFEPLAERIADRIKEPGNRAGWSKYPKPAEEVYDAELLASLAAPRLRRDPSDRPVGPHGSVNKGF